MLLAGVVGAFLPAAAHPAARAVKPATVTSVIADNRGEVTITLSGQVSAAAVNKNSVQIYTAGPDGVLGTADDSRQATSIRWSDSSNRIILSSDLPANTAYRIKLVASRLKNSAGKALDGDFGGVFPSGNGSPGGNFEFIARPDKSATPQVRMTSSVGVITLKLFRKQKPISVANFLSYADRGDYDGIFWTRSITQPKPFIIQAGSLRIAEDDTIQEVEAQDPIPNEFATKGIIRNTRGTIAFAKSPGDPNSATNQFFLNLSNNGGTAPAGLDYQNGGFTVFGKVANASSATVMDAIAAHNTVALHNDATGDGVVRAFASTGLTDTPVQNRDLLTTQIQNVSISDQTPRFQYVATGGFDPQRDLITIRRCAALMKVTAVKAGKSSKSAAK